MKREAACACGGLRIALEGDPASVSSCCCQQCQRRTGGFFGVAAFYMKAQVAGVTGESHTFRRIGDSGLGLTFHFCPTCGSTVYWEPEFRPGLVAVAGGAFADPSFPAPARMVWTEYRHPFVRVPEGTPEFKRAPP